MFFLSSPPQPLPRLQTINGTFNFTNSPITPSPLRTSYNANGIRRSRMSDHHQPQSHSSPLGKSSAPIWDIENDSPSTPPPPSDQPSSTTLPTSAFTFTATVPSSASSTVTNPHTQPLFAYASRARAASPAAQLGSRAAASRTNNKARFLERLRTKRDEGLGRDDKVLRADYLDERRAWEEEMARRASVEVEEEEEVDGQEKEGDMEIEMQGVDGDGEGQSPTEEKEIEALLALMEQQEQVGTYDDGVGEIGDSQEWDDVFMEVLSQQTPSWGLRSDHPDGRGDTAAGGGDDVDMS